VRFLICALISQANLIRTDIGNNQYNSDQRIYNSDQRTYNPDQRVYSDQRVYNPDKRVYNQDKRVYNVKIKKIYKIYKIYEIYDNPDGRLVLRDVLHAFVVWVVLLACIWVVLRLLFA
jgi:hypothetical protein